jgi:hypothetical protein
VHGADILGDTYGMANIPGRNTLPSSRGQDFHSGVLGALMHDERSLQRALVDRGCCTDGLVRAGIDEEVVGVVSRARSGLSPGPGVGGRCLYGELGFSDVRNTYCKR